MSDEARWPDNLTDEAFREALESVEINLLPLLRRLHELIAQEETEAEAEAETA